MLKLAFATIALLATDPAFATEAAKPKAPDTVTETEALKLQNFDLQSALLQQQATQLQADRKAFVDSLSKKYHLTEKDQIDRATHQIVRR